jgi:hypothetical protein
VKFPLHFWFLLEKLCDMDPSQSSPPRSSDQLFFEAITSHLNKVLSQKVDGVYSDMGRLIKYSMDESIPRHQPRLPSRRPSEGNSSPLLHAQHDIGHRLHVHSRPRQEHLNGHTWNDRHVHHSSGEDDFLYIPRHRENRARRRHDNILDDIPLFGDPTLQNRHIGAKLDIPYFDRNVNPERYLEWELILNLLFDIQVLDDELKIALVTLHLTKYTLLWWDSPK